MNVLVSAQGNDLNAVVDPRFGRAAWFLLVDTETGTFTAHDNGANADSAHGAGNASAAQAATLGAQVLISGNVGPNAFRALKAAGISVYTIDHGTVQEALTAFSEGSLKKLEDASVSGWS
jgi:predicted Fe-Mo cluster-binding NifX family protein